MGTEFLYYGMCYIKEGSRHYVIGTRAEEMLALRKRCLEEGWYPSLICMENVRFQVPVGQYDSVHRWMKQRIAERLEKAYPQSYYDRLQGMGTQKYAANALMESVMQEVESGFRYEVADIFEGLLLECLVMQRIDKACYELLKEKVRREKGKLEKEEAVGKYRRRFYGFAYGKGERVRYYANATQWNAYERRERCILEGYVVSPMLEKEYGTEIYGELTGKKKVFTEVLQMYFSQEFMKGLEELWETDSGVDAKRYQKEKDELQMEGREEAIRNFCYYGRLWGVEK